MKLPTTTGVTPELLDRWAELDGDADMPFGVGACCLTHQVTAMQPRPISRPRKPRLSHKKVNTVQATDRELVEA
jgi:hypothetical protein